LECSNEAANKTNIMTTINLKTISNKNFESIIQNLIGTNCEMEFSNYTEKHETIALNLGLTIQYDGKTLNVLCTEDEANNYY
jgi:hypothetical protein